VGHETVSTFAIGREKNQKEWQAVGRELMRLGLLHQAEGRPGTVTITPEGREILRRRATVMLTRAAQAQTEVPAALPCDEALFASLRALRRTLAAERAVPPYVIFPDSSLLQMAREYPTDAAAFARISGVGDRKLADLGPAFMQAIAAHVAAHGRIFREPAPARAGPRSAV
jgi:ATP-dependent DNA helicase RecQ